MSAPLLFELLSTLNTLGGSDLYLTVGHPPALRLDSRLQNLRDTPLSPEELHGIMVALLTDRQMHEFDSRMELNTSLDLGEHGRFRVNALRQRQHPALVIRRIISKIPSFSELNLPPIVGQLATLKHGLVLITGMTGSGKSTTLASMIDYRNRTEQGHIVTLEDPIEYFHEHQKSVITQREVGVDTESYETALKNVLRQRPDVIMIGEIRDREVMEQALLISETGHLCLATLHTNNTYQAIERVINFFPDDQSQQIRTNLGQNLQAIIAQRLVPGKDHATHLALEIMMNQGHIRELIFDGKANKIREVMEQNIAHGMCTFDHSLYHLYVRGQITEETAIAHADIPGDLKIRIRQRQVSHNQTEFKNMDTAGLTLSDPDTKRYQQ